MKTRFSLAAATFGIALALAACGADEEAPPGSADGTGTEAAFLKSMIPHHESAVEMAEMARDQAERRAVKGLAAEIISAQEDEISQMEQIYERLYGDEILPDPQASTELGLSMKESGMHDGSVVLERAKEFDRAFIDQMIPHHQGAIRQARVVLGATEDEELTALAQAIIDAQSREIRAMNSWRKRWYGRESPAGGVPPASEPAPADGEHSAH